MLFRAFRVIATGQFLDVLMTDAGQPVMIIEPHPDQKGHKYEQIETQIAVAFSVKVTPEYLADIVAAYPGLKASDIEAVESEDADPRTGVLMESTPVLEPPSPEEVKLAETLAAIDNAKSQDAVKEVIKDILIKNRLVRN